MAHGRHCPQVVEGAGHSLESLLYGHKSHLLGLHLHDLFISPNPTSIGNLVQHVNFRGTQTSSHGPKVVSSEGFLEPSCRMVPEPRPGAPEPLLLRNRWGTVAQCECSQCTRRENLPLACGNNSYKHLSVPLLSALDQPEEVHGSYSASVCGKAG